MVTHKHWEEGIISADLVPELQDDLLSAVDQPLRIAKVRFQRMICCFISKELIDPETESSVMQDKETGKEYLTCDYNRDGDSYR